MKSLEWTAFLGDPVRYRSPPKNMPRMLELVRANALASHQMMTAAKGALNLPAVETIEILVYIAEHHRIFGETARVTLAGWDEAACKIVAADPNAPREVLEYWLSPKNIRPSLFPVLIENLSVPAEKLSSLATTLKGEMIDVMIASPRVQDSAQLMEALSSNTERTGAQTARIELLLAGGAAAAPTPAEPEVSTSALVLAPEQDEENAPIEHVSDEPAPTADSEAEIENALVAFFTEHAAEIAAEDHKQSQPIDAIHADDPAHEVPAHDVPAKEVPAQEVPAQDQRASAAAAGATAPAPGGAPKPGISKKVGNPEGEKRGSVLQKIAVLDIKGRIQLAMKGSKEERSILVRDGTKIVALAVLDSPKISDGEVEKIASQKNVLEAVLRAIPLRRRFIKNYPVVRNLVFNPRTPLDVSLGLMKNLLAADLKNLTGNKEVADTVRKLALRMFRQKTEGANKK